MRLARKTLKVFADGADNNGVFGSLQANNPQSTNDVDVLQSLSAWSEGWNAATMTSDDLPPLEEMQGVQYVITYEIGYLYQEGIPEWKSDTTYYIGSLAKVIDGDKIRVYSSLVNDNLNRLTSDGKSWKLIYDSAKTYVDTVLGDARYVTVEGDQTVNGGKTFTSDMMMLGSDIIFDNGSIGGTKFTVQGDTLSLKSSGAMDTNSASLTVKTGNITVTGTAVDYTTASMNISASGSEFNMDNNVTLTGGTITVTGNTVLTGGTTKAVTPNKESNSTDIATTAWVRSLNARTFVTLDGTQTITGAKTFDKDLTLNGSLKMNGSVTGVTNINGIVGLNGGVTVPTPAASASGLEAVNAAWINGAGNNIVHKTGSETISGAKTFNNINVATASLADNSQKAVNTTYIQTKFRIVSSLPSNPDANTFYFIAE